MKITIAGMIAAGNGITLFLADGQSRVLPSDGWHTQKIVDAIMPSLSQMKPVEIDLDNFSIAKQVEQLGVGNLKVDENENITVQTKSGALQNAHALRPHIEQALHGSGAHGFKKFMRSLDEMIKKRAYAASELMDHMQHGDLPIADDGCLIGYKVLGQSEGEYMVDHHTGRVKQRLGSLVYMPESKVDQSRALCSTGLHIASRKYIKGFWYGNSRLCLVKIKPKDVVSVPQGEASKMRVSAYHIVGVFGQSDGEKIATGTKIEDLPAAQELLENVVVGNHTPIIETVEVTGRGEITVKVLTKVKARSAKKHRKLTKPLRPKGVNAKLIKTKLKALKGGSDNVYSRKLARAQSFYDKGKSIRWISAKLNMDRESLGKNLNRRKKAA